MKTIVSLVCITIIELYALNQQVNGVLLSLALVSIAGLGGYSAAKIKKGG